MSHPCQAPVTQATFDLSSNCNMQTHQSLPTGPVQASTGPVVGATQVTIPFCCYLCQPGNPRRYAWKGDLTRHIKTVHGAPSCFLCHIHQCPRGILGGGLARKDKLVDHLKSSKPGHGLCHQDAVYQAALHNMPNTSAVYQHVSSGASRAQQVTLNNASRPGPAQQVVMHNTIPNELVDPAFLHGTSQNYSGYHLAIQGNAYENVSAYGPVDNIFNESAYDQTAFTTTSHENAVDHATSNSNFSVDGHPAWR